MISLHFAFSHPYIVQDDARIHIVWLQQLIDRQLFPDDLFARYYQAIQPLGLRSLYKAFTWLGLQPMLLAKLLPLGLGLLTTVYSFYLSLKFLPIPSSAFLSTLILNQNIWLKDDLISATPRSFNYLLLSAFLYYLLHRAWVPCLLALTLQGLFYPQLMLVEIALLGLRCWRWRRRSLRPSTQVIDYGVWVAALAIGLAVILGFSSSVTQEFGSLVTVDQMHTMPEFGINGRRQYFGVDPLRFWFAGASGLRLPLFPPIIWLSLGLPVLLRRQLRLSYSIAHVGLLGQLAIASLSLFGLAHLLFPVLYLPSRYTFYSGRLLMAIAAGMVLFVLIDRGYTWLRSRQRLQQRLNLKQRLVVGLCGLFAVVAVVLPAIPPLFLDCQNWIVGEAPELYQFLQRQPKDSLVASLTLEANNIPAFAQRSVFVSQELAMPYHSSFYRQVQQRMSDLIRAQYSPNLSETQAILQKHRIDLLIIDNRSFSPEYLLQQDWLVNSSVNNTVIQTATQVQQGSVPALSQLGDRCAVFQAEQFIVLDVACIQALPSGSS